jgi:STE24 endopeptidase
LLVTEALTITIGTPLLVAFLKIIDHFGKRTFAFYVMIFLVSVQVIMIAVYPVLIQPLFNKLEPLSEGEVKTKTEELAKQLKFPLGKLWVIDGSKRSAHSNAYFYGLPWSKQIVCL